MNTQILFEKPKTRREFLGRAAALAACAFVPQHVLQGSNSVAEVAKCVHYCQEALT
jgi:hypothetical protein